MRFNVDLPNSLNLDGVYLCHNGFGIVIDANAMIGKGAVIQNSVCVGEMDATHKCPVIGENVFIGCHASILEDIKIGNNDKIGAGAVVIPDNCTAVGVPARIIKSGKKMNIKLKLLNMYGKVRSLLYDKLTQIKCEVSISDLMLRRSEITFG